jgi:DNA mismatch repair protein MSH4
VLRSYVIVQTAIDARLDVVQGQTRLLPLPVSHLTVAAVCSGLAELAQSEDRFADLRDALKTFNKMDFDKLIAAVDPSLIGKSKPYLMPVCSSASFQLAASEARETATTKGASARVAQMINLRSIIRNLPLLRRAVENSKSQLLRLIHDVRHAFFSL